MYLPRCFLIPMLLTATLPAMAQVTGQNAQPDGTYTITTGSQLVV